MTFTFKLTSILYLPSVNTVRFEKGEYISGIKVFSHHPQSIKTLVNDKKSFKLALKRFLCQNSFYSVNEFLQYREDKGQ
jgi:hypothetical protein